MNTDHFDDLDSEVEDYTENAEPIVTEPPSTRLERRRRIEDLFEEKRLKEELEDFG